MGATRQVRPSAPTACLPPLSRLPSCSLDRIAEALANLHVLYLPSRSLQQNILLKSKHLPSHAIHDISVPDSGYASEEDDDDGGEDGFDIDLLRSDPFEREFAIRWLTGFAARSDTWVYLDDEEVARTKLVDDAAALLASFACEEESEEAEEGITRKFVFPVGTDGKESVVVELNDAPLLSDDHTSVGLQSWASSVLLAERMCLDPDAWGFFNTDREATRVLELGAGTGLLSIVAAKLMHHSSQTQRIIATDFHPSVLANLKANVHTNFRSASSPPVDVLKLDWQYPVYDVPLDKPFDVILAADVVYEPEHAQWIKACVEHTLSRPNSPTSLDGGVFWLIIAVRSSGRHEGLDSTVTDVFPWASSVASNTPELAILDRETIGRLSGVGRADESAYALFKIGWVCQGMNTS
ncbi:putative methyltransferase-domain-containing protein [Cristinia sonorae]|uniref:Methyltransferase-domain-containing protein n=1 Tax=Cristinia sonorae TaxID=1940300 RepID=A0A8K0UKP8_9AGAR|nr:putative methyltransferase-domain-containing protein [Cristinia sonorae]